MNKLKKLLKKLTRWATKYKACRYAIYAMLSLLLIPARFVVALVLGYIAAILEETVSAASETKKEYLTIFFLLHKERENTINDLS